MGQLSTSSISILVGTTTSRRPKANESQTAINFFLFALSLTGLTKAASHKFDVVTLSPQPEVRGPDAIIAAHHQLLVSLPSSAPRSPCTAKTASRSAH